MVILAILAVLVPPEAEIQGLYGGSLAGKSVEARLVAMGKSSFKLWVRVDNVRKATLEGKLEEETLRLVGEGWKASYAAGSLKGTAGEVFFELKRVVRKPASLGRKPPEGAVVLIDGKNFGEIVRGGNEEIPWKVGDDGSISVRPKGLNSKRAFEGTSPRFQVRRGDRIHPIARPRI